jgi:hypothetical protein
VSYRGRMYGDYLPGYGDPGFLGSIFGAVKKIGGIALHTVAGGLTGGIPGAIIGAVTGSARETAAGINEATLAAGGSQSAYTPVLRKAHAAIVARSKRLGSTQPIASLPAGTAHGLGGGANGGGGGGYHPSKRHLAALARGLTRAPPRMNPYNPRALRRAGRRITSFVRTAGKLIRMVHPHKTGRVAFRFPKKRRK